MALLFDDEGDMIKIITRFLCCGPLLFLVSCANVNPVGTAISAIQSNNVFLIPSVDAVGELPPPPPHAWADDAEDVNENRAVGDGLVSIPVMETYLNNLLTKIKALAEVPDWPGRVYISSETSLNAHSSAAGNIYLNIAVLQSAESEDEIFAVLTHEFAHIYLNHQAAYRAKLVTGTVVFAARAVVSVATKSMGVGAWNPADTVAAAGSLTDSVVIPSWQRSVEEQADRFGVTLSLKGGYSYVAGFKTFLERLASVDRKFYGKGAVDKKGNSEKARKDAGADIKGAINQSSAALLSSIGALRDAAEKSHDDAEIRERNLTTEVRPLIKGKRVREKTAPWREVKREKSVANVLAHFSMQEKIEALMQARNFKAAAKTASIAASGETEHDGASLMALFNVLHTAGGTSPEVQINLLLKNQLSLQRSWQVQMQIARLMVVANPQQAKSFIEKQYDYFGGAPSTAPDLIDFYVNALNDPLDAAKLNIVCVASNPRFRQACIEHSLTAAQRLEAKAKSEARAKQLGDRLGSRINDALGIH